MQFLRHACTFCAVLLWRISCEYVFSASLLPKESRLTVRGRGNFLFVYVALYLLVCFDGTFSAYGRPVAPPTHSSFQI
jgi:hypothetical protein